MSLNNGHCIGQPPPRIFIPICLCIPESLSQGLYRILHGSCKAWFTLGLFELLESCRKTQKTKDSEFEAANGLSKFVLISKIEALVFSQSSLAKYP